MPLKQAPSFGTWPDLWLSVAQMLDGRSHVRLGVVASTLIQIGIIWRMAQKHAPAPVSPFLVW